jgi:hypothetical protein
MSFVIAAPELAAAEAPTTGSSWHSAKVIENTVIGPSVMHDQWFWMNAPEIHSSTWKWDE